MLDMAYYLFLKSFWVNKLTTVRKKSPKFGGSQVRANATCPAEVMVKFGVGMLKNTFRKYIMSSFKNSKAMFL